MISCAYKFDSRDTATPLARCPYASAAFANCLVNQSVFFTMGQCVFFKGIYDIKTIKSSFCEGSGRFRINAFFDDLRAQGEAPCT